ncbi:ENTH-domain-containing protein [Thelephora ganbajun]|uniref:ENTH-domain-containing protein n=1 Tax=Thelephora ganbajun TaxID=370292 RepID=A0ACB6ZJT5_THEGA|nr:ENTH-domain-containing protein [Thelephora ganbajun]
MDRLEALGNSLSQITLYDIKSMYNQAKNVVLNVSEMEAKVQEATNDEPWGASSTLMQEIAQGTFNFQHFNEIMPAIYSRFMEKEARQWRQIYKALQLLEYLVKNGSERVVDDARSHISTVKMLRNFYYVDDKGKDQGINVRNRSKEIVELLSDVEKIRAERRKAKANKTKYTGVGNEGWGPTSGGSRYGGFGSDSLGSGGSGSYGGYDGDDDGNYSGSGNRSGGDGGYSGSSYSGGSHSKRFQEYDAGDDETPRRSSLSTSDARPSSTQQKGKSTLSQSTAVPTKAPEKPPVQEVDLLGFADDDPFSGGSALSPPIGAPGLAPPQPTQPVASLDDDDFDDFQAAPPSTTSSGFTVPVQPARPVIPLQPAQQIKSAVPLQPVQPVQQPNFFGSGMNVMSPGSGTTSPSYGAPNYNVSTSIMSPASPPLQQRGILSPGLASGPAKPTTASSTPAKPTTSANFDDLWNLSLGTTSTANKSNTNTAPAKSMKDLEKEKATAGIWGAMNQNQTKQPTMGGGLWGSSNTTTANTNTAKPSGGVDDLLF